MDKTNTIIAKACTQVTGFSALYRRLNKRIVVNGLSNSTLNNYIRCLAHLALRFKCLPHHLDQEVIEDYLLSVKQENKTPSQSFFKHTVYGLRFLLRSEGMADRVIKLPRLKREHKLPVVLARSEIKILLKAPALLKHRVLLGLLYGCGLRSHEIRSLQIRDIDFKRNTVHVRRGKGNKDRYVPLGFHLSRGLATYIHKETPFLWLFNGKSRYHSMTQRGIQNVMHAAVRKSQLRKHVTAHTLRHTYATHLLEDGLDIVSIKELLGHAFIETTMIYLHIAKTGKQAKFCPLDSLYLPSVTPHCERCRRNLEERLFAGEMISNR